MSPDPSGPSCFSHDIADMQQLASADPDTGSMHRALICLGATVDSYLMLELYQLSGPATFSSWSAVMPSLALMNSAYIYLG